MIDLQLSDKSLHRPSRKHGFGSFGQTDTRVDQNASRSEPGASVLSSESESTGDSIKTQNGRTSRSLRKTTKKTISRAKSKKTKKGAQSIRKKKSKCRNTQKKGQSNSSLLLKRSRTNPRDTQSTLTKSVTQSSQAQPESDINAFSKYSQTNTTPTEAQPDEWGSPQPSYKEHPENTNFLIVQQMRRLKKQSHKHKLGSIRSKASRRKLMFPTQSTKSLTKKLDANRLQSKPGRAADVPSRPGKGQSTVRRKPQLQIETDQLVRLEHIVSPINNLNPNRLDFSINESIAFVNSSVSRTNTGEDTGRKTMTPGTGRQDMANNLAEHSGSRGATRRITFPKYRSGKSDVKFMEYYGSKQI